MYNFFARHASYVLIGREQYEVLLDNHDNPSELWSTIKFELGNVVTFDGGKPRYVIIAQSKQAMGIWLHRLRLEDL